MTPISIVAILMSFAAIGFSWSRLTTSRLLMSVMLLIIHVAASIYYYGYSLNNVADASAYYFDPIGAAAQPWQIGTVFVTKLCRMLKTQFGASYLAARWAGLSRDEGKVIGIMMNTRALMELIVINVGYDLGVISQQLFTMLVLMAIFSTVITMPGLRRWLPRIGVGLPGGVSPLPQAAAQSSAP